MGWRIKYSIPTTWTNLLRQLFCCWRNKLRPLDQTQLYFDRKSYLWMAGKVVVCEKRWTGWSLERILIFYVIRPFFVVFFNPAIDSLLEFFNCTGWNVFATAKENLVKICHLCNVYKPFIWNFWTSSQVKGLQRWHWCEIAQAFVRDVRAWTQTQPFYGFHSYEMA